MGIEIIPLKISENIFAFAIPKGTKENNNTNSAMPKRVLLCVDTVCMKSTIRLCIWLLYYIPERVKMESHSFLMKLRMRSKWYFIPSSKEFYVKAKHCHDDIHNCPSKQEDENTIKVGAEYRANTCYDIGRSKREVS